MPYADPEKRRECRARSFRKKLADPEFRARETERKKKWLESEEARRLNAEASKRARITAKVVAEIEAVGLEQWKARRRRKYA